MSSSVCQGWEFGLFADKLSTFVRLQKCVVHKYFVEPFLSILKFLPNFGRFRMWYHENVSMCIFTSTLPNLTVEITQFDTAIPENGNSS